MNTMDQGNLEGSDLEHRLQHLFGTPALDLTPHAGATTAVLGRVRRARRRRQVVRTGAVGLAAASVLAIGLGTPSLLGDRDARITTPAATATAPTTDDSDELPMTGTGVGRLRLGMSAADARATGLLAEAAADSTERCQVYRGRAGTGIRQVTIGSGGVHSISVNQFIRTKEGLSGESRFEDLRATFGAGLTVDGTASSDRSGAFAGQSVYRAPVDGSPGVSYRFDLDDSEPTDDTRIVGITLENEDPTCP